MIGPGYHFNPRPHTLKGNCGALATKLQGAEHKISWRVERTRRRPPHPKETPALVGQAEEKLNRGLSHIHYCRHELDREIRAYRKIHTDRPLPCLLLRKLKAKEKRGIITLANANLIEIHRPVSATPQVSATVMMSSMARTVPL